MFKVSGNKYVVTGGSGFIGSHICEELLSQGKEVVSIDNYVYGTRHNIEPFLDNHRFTAINADISKAEDLKGRFDGADGVFNLAASKCTYCRVDPALDMRVNGLGALNVATEAVMAKVKKVVHVSTGSVYGLNPDYNDLSVFQEDGVSFAPVSYYGVSKLAGERYFEAIRQYYGLRHTIARYYHVYGPRQKGGSRGGVIPIFIQKILAGEPIHIFGDGKQIRAFTYVKDTVHHTLRLMEDEATDFEAYNIASNERVTISYLAYKLMELMKKEVPVIHEGARQGDIHDIEVSNEKIGPYDWKSFEEGIASTIAHYREVQNA